MRGIDMKEENDENVKMHMDEKRYAYGELRLKKDSRRIISSTSAAGWLNPDELDDCPHVDTYSSGVTASRVS
uniref:Uncharacterized protein n=1 Tax=Pristionchus pacificus TaxID=54126 RepID=A0A2A6BHP5_PRIPA|eukprot:PDM65331.1 hypothetical protein PRIPAC_52273 [Pristionchus pacificus]